MTRGDQIVRSSVSVTSSPSLRGRSLPQQEQVVGPGSTTRSGGRCSGNGLRAGRLRVDAATADGGFGGNLILGGRALELLEGQLHLVEQPRRPFRALAEELALQLLDLQLLVRDQSLVVGGLGPGHRRLRLDPGRVLEPLPPLGGQRRLQRVDIIRQGIRSGVCTRMESEIRAAGSPKMRTSILSCTLRPEGVARVPPVDSVERRATGISLLGRLMNH